MTSESQGPQPPGGTGTPLPPSGWQRVQQAVSRRFDLRVLTRRESAWCCWARSGWTHACVSTSCSTTSRASLVEAEAYNKESRQVASQTQAAMHDLEYKIGMLESRLSETQNQRLALEGLYLELSRNRDERILAEVEQILLVGSQQLQLAGNLKAALIALESADSRLQRADSAQFTGLRRAIRLDIERLKAAPYVDVIGMSLRLDTLAHQAASLPLAMDERPPEVPRSAPRARRGRCGASGARSLGGPQGPDPGAAHRRRRGAAAVAGPAVLPA